MELNTDHKRTLYQIGMYARNLMFENMSLFVFVIGIYGHTARIYRFDHAGAVASPSFNYVFHPYLLGEFYWRLVNPVVDIVDVEDGESGIVKSGKLFIVGSDTTITRTTPETLCNQWALVPAISAHINKHDAVGIASSLQAGYTIRARFGYEPTHFRTFLSLGEPLYHSPGLFSRGTCVWSVVPVPQTISEPVRIYALKDTWRGRHRDPEADNYHRIYKNEQSELHGLAKCYGSVDFGELFSGHRTVCARITDGDLDLRNRHHTRILLSPVGRKLNQFRSTKFLIEGVIDAIIGTQN